MTTSMMVQRNEDEITLVCSEQWNINILRETLQEHITKPSLIDGDFNVKIDLRNIKDIRPTKQYIMPIINTIHATQGIKHTTLIVNHGQSANKLNSILVNLNIIDISVYPVKG